MPGVEMAEFSIRSAQIWFQLKVHLSLKDATGVEFDKRVVIMLRKLKDKQHFD